MKKLYLILLVFGASAILWLLSLCRESAQPQPTSKATPDLPRQEPLTKTGIEPPKQPHPAQVAAAEASNNAPINIYGKVIDQHGNSVSEANIAFYVLGHTSSSKPTGQRTTDNMGAFNITGFRGLALTIVGAKTGYRQLPNSDDKVASAKMFYFGLGHPPQSSTEAPIVFTLHKPGVIEPLVQVGEKNFRMQRDGTPIEIDLQPGGSPSVHRVTLRCWNKELESRPANQNRYDWRLEISPNAGSIIERKDIMDFEAPTEDYQLSAVIDMPITAKPIWSSSPKRSYFFKFNDGVYARADVEMIAGGDHFVVWESYLNPKAGSRTLETDSTTKR